MAVPPLTARLPLDDAGVARRRERGELLPGVCVLHVADSGFLRVCCFIWAPLSQQQDQRWSLAVPRQLLIGFAGTLHQRSHFNETDQVLASLQRKQRAFNPLISEN